MNWQEIKEAIVTWLLTDGIKLLIALVVGYLAFRLINFIARRIEKRNEKTQKIDPTAMGIAVRIVRAVLKLVVVAVAVGFVGIDTSGLSALIGSIGVTIGLAVNGALSNVAGGLILAITHPFKIDDYIAVAGVEGTVKDIRILSVKLQTFDGKIVHVPNGTFPTSNVTNYTELGQRRVEYKFSIAYSADFKLARDLLLGIFSSDGRVMPDPEPAVVMSAHGESSIELTARCWVKSEDYWGVYFNLIEKAKQLFDENGIEIPFNQMDVHIVK